MKEKAINNSEFLKRKKRSVLIATQSSKGPYVQLENKQFGFTNGALQILGSRGLDTYLPVPPPFVTPVCIGTYTREPSYNNYGPLVITSSGYTFGANSPSFPPYSIYPGMNIQFPSPSTTYFVVLVNCTANTLYFSLDNGLTKGIISSNRYGYIGTAIPNGISITSS